MNPYLGAFLIIVALAATYVFARANIPAGTTIATVLAAGVTLLQAKSHAAALAKVPPAPPPAAAS